MQEVFLGEAIKRRRLELGLTQEQLSRGICEPITVSRLENGRQTPSRNRIQALLARLGMPTDRYYAFLSKKELDVEELCSRIATCNIQFLNAIDADRQYIRDKGLRMHQELKTLVPEDDVLVRQLIIRSQVILGQEDGPYTYAEQRKKLMEAIRLTSPSFNIEEIGTGLYTIDEIKIINQLALIHVHAGEHMDAIEIFSQLYKYICRHFYNTPQIKAYLGIIACNYANELYAIGQYKKALEIAEEGRKICINYGGHQALPELVAVEAKCFHFLQDEEKSLHLFYQAYYLLNAFGNNRALERLKKDAQELLNIRMDDLPHGAGNLDAACADEGS